MKKVRLVFVEASIETIPEELWSHPSVKSDSKRRRRHPSRILLYIPIHYTAMKDHGIPTAKRGRPDILHRALLMTLDSPLNKEKCLEIYIHTQDDKIIWVNPETRIPPDYYRFEGLMIQLLRRGEIPPGETPKFMKIINKNLKDILRENGRKIYLLSKNGEQITVDKAREMIGNTIVIGSFQEGEFRKDIFEQADIEISISPYIHRTSYVTCNILTYIYMARQEDIAKK